MAPARDPGRTATLERFGLDESDLIGEGSESRVYALGRDRVLRIRRTPAAERGEIETVARFLDTIAGRLPFATPEIERIEPDGSTVEKRLAGTPLSDLLPRLDGARRRAALSAYFDAANAFGRLAMPDQPYGLLLAGARVTADTWPGFFVASLERHVARTRPHLEALFGDVEDLVAKARALIAPLPDRPPKVLAHGDVYPGNVLMDDDLQVTAVVDFGVWTLVAEPLYDVTSAVMFTEIADSCGPRDIAWLRSLLVAHAGEAAIPAMTFYRAYFAFTLFDPDDRTGLYPRLRPWSLAALRQIRDGTLGDWAMSTG
jgi:aminoglycoside phosphotransferase (APT) family kinase protein